MNRQSEFHSAKIKFLRCNFYTMLRTAATLKTCEDISVNAFFPMLDAFKKIFSFLPILPVATILLQNVQGLFPQIFLLQLNKDIMKNTSFTKITAEKWNTIL